MQLSSTLFAVCVLQIKPQLEKLLRLNRDTLTKEVELTQHLLELFIKYQIPSDLLAFGDLDNTTARCKLKRVKRSVERVQGMISRAKQLELRELAQEATNDDLQCDMYCGSEEGGECEDEDENCDYFALSTSTCEGESKQSERLSSRSASAQIQNASRGDIPKRKRKPRVDDDLPMEQEELAFDDRPSGIRKRSRSFSGERCFFEQECGEADYRAPQKEELADEEEEEEEYESDASSSNSPDSVGKVEGKAEKQEPEQEPDEGPQSEDEIDPDYRVAVSAPPDPPAPATPMLDFANMPSALESRLSMLDPDGALRPTILEVGGDWQRMRPQGLLGRVVSMNLGADEQKREKNDAFDLLDALTRSGELLFEEASLHVLVCSTHCFDETVMDCLVKKNINPVEKVDRSTLVVASTVHEQAPQVMLQPTQLEAARMFNPQLFLQN